MSYKPNPTPDAALAFRTSWGNFMAAHNNPDRQKYNDSFAAPSPVTLKTAYEKFLIATHFPTPLTAVTPLNELSSAETTALLYYFDQKKINSTLDWDADNPVPLLTIRYVQNQHFDVSLLQTIRDHQSRLFPVNTLQADSQKATSSYIPPFNVQTTDKGIYILLDYMHIEDESLLSVVLKEKAIPFRDKDSPTFGHVFAVPLSDMKAIQELAKLHVDARTEHNLNNRPQHARILAPRPGPLTITVLEDPHARYIPLEGMGAQKNALATLLTDNSVPFYHQLHAQFGEVYAVPDHFSSQLESLSIQLRVARHQACQQVDAHAFAACTPA